MLVLQAEAQAQPAAITVTRYTTITQYEYTGVPQSQPTAGPDGEGMGASASVDEDSVMASATVSGKAAKETSVDASESGMPSIERIAKDKDMKPTASVNPNVSVSSSGTALFTFTPLTLAPEKSKAMASASKFAVDPRPSVTRPNTSGADVLSASKLAVAAIAAVAGLAVL
ncbi:hypothetical protein K450DRAFT_283900, partial [Umbelopsis ramanniana AG]